MSIAASVNNVSLPGIVPGANNNALRSLTLTMSIPGRFFAAFDKLQSFETTNNNDFFFTVFLPLSLPIPARILEILALFNSSLKFKARRANFTSLVLSNFSKSEDNIKG